MVGETWFKLYRDNSFYSRETIIYMQILYE